MNMVYNQLVQALKNEGVEAINSVGEQFDPHLHQAVMQIEDENYESNSVVEELQKGYKLKDRVIRPAMVKVNQ
jgi:molecular chaperone GrpE